MLLVALWHAIEYIVVCESGPTATDPESALPSTPLGFETLHERTPEALQKRLVREPAEIVEGDIHISAFSGPRYCGVLVAFGAGDGAGDGAGGGAAGASAGGIMEYPCDVHRVSR
jgi:hypothetical protein